MLVVTDLGGLGTCTHQHEMTVRLSARGRRGLEGLGTTNERSGEGPPILIIRNPMLHGDWTEYVHRTCPCK